MLDQLITRKTLYDAFERVQENGGCRGADGVTLADFQASLETELDSLQDRLIRRRYTPFPLLRFQIPKREEGFRDLTVPTIRDRVLQTAAYQLTREIFEAEFEECSYAFREGRSVKDAVHRIDQLRSQGFRFVVDADVEGFFDNVDQDHLVARLRRLPLDPYVVALFELWIRAEVYDGHRLFLLTRGIPQGSVVSPMLANLFLDELDENLALFGQTLVRYADDFLVLCKQPEDASQALEITDYLLEDLHLKLNQEKTRTTSFDQGFKFLGAVFLKDAIYLPFDRPKLERTTPHFPPPLDLLTYLELKHLGQHLPSE
ncbi:MAG: RNA-directed DNA polymerase [Acidobacteria bacterium]|nr:RNA-directed DNA polymerase [Acidobacteriota bacterium]